MIDNYTVGILEDVSIAILCLNLLAANKWFAAHPQGDNLWAIEVHGEDKDFLDAWLVKVKASRE